MPALVLLEAGFAVAAEDRARDGVFVFFLAERCDVDGANGDGAINPYFSESSSACCLAPATIACIRVLG